MEYLVSLFDAGKAFATINVHKSMLSSTLSLVSGASIGTEPVIVRLMKSFYNLRPPQPRYRNTWPIEKVFNLFVSMEANDNLDLKALTEKLATILALATLLRTSELASITFESISITPQKVSFALGRPRKAQRAGSLRLFCLSAFDVPNLCPVSCTSAYLQRTASRRGADNANRLLLSLIRPFGAVSGSTVARWIKATLERAGIDIAIFTAHSVRGAASSGALARGIPIEDILRAGDWSSNQTFARFYHRTVPAPSNNTPGLGITHSRSRANLEGNRRLHEASRSEADVQSRLPEE